MGERINRIAVRSEGPATDLAEGVEISAARKPWTAPVMIRSTLADAEVGTSGAPDGPTVLS